jgi:hypothetical protein
MIIKVTVNTQDLKQQAEEWLRARAMCSNANKR